MIGHHDAGNRDVFSPVFDTDYPILTEREVQDRLDRDEKLPRYMIVSKDDGRLLLWEDGKASLVR